jgi:hypothetical protein
MTWTCRHCEHWQRGKVGDSCAHGLETFFVLTASDCAHFYREPGADDDLADSCLTGVGGENGR